ncbi:hypothetical protein Bca4012_027137 [Brassica carinata]
MLLIDEKLTLLRSTTSNFQIQPSPFRLTKLTKFVEQSPFVLAISPKGRIVHGDVKTKNMHLDYQSNLKITDFGVARVDAQNPKDMAGESVTFGYMAPQLCDVLR